MNTKSYSCLFLLLVLATNVLFAQRDLSLATPFDLNSGSKEVLAFNGALDLQYADYKITKSKGSNLVYSGQEVKSYTIEELRLLSSIETTHNKVYASTNAGMEGFWKVDSLDTSSLDNLGTVLVTTSGKRIKRIFDSAVSVKWFGAKGNFDPSIGIFTNDRGAIQAAFNYATQKSGITIVFPTGKYYGGASSGTYIGGVQIVLGDTIVNSARNINIIGEGAELYQGASGRFIGIFGGNRVRISGFKMFGYTGGVLNSSRERDALITINYNSQNITVDNNYLTNSLGDCIYAGGSLVASGGVGYETRNLTIRNNILKERIGNNIMSVNGGTKSRLAVAIIDCIGGSVHDNTIYGGVDLETNINNQHIVSVKIANNSFRSGNVTPQTSIGSNYWYDEPINASGGSVINQWIALTGRAGSPIVSGNVVQDNTFEYGIISCELVNSFDRISNNSFVYGMIEVGDTSGTNYTNYITVDGNIARYPRTSETTFIKINGMVYLCTFLNNIAKQNFNYCINTNGVATGDGGRCSFVNNILASGTNVLGFLPASTSVLSGNLKTGITNNNGGEFNRVFVNELNAVKAFSQMDTLHANAGANTFSYTNRRGNIWYITTASSTAASITDITNELGDGQTLTIVSGASTSGGSLTVTHGAGTIRVKGGGSVVIPTNECITFYNRNGIWFEMSRSF